MLTLNMLFGTPPAFLLLLVTALLATSRLGAVADEAPPKPPICSKGESCWDNCTEATCDLRVIRHPQHKEGCNSTDRLDPCRAARPPVRRNLVRENIYSYILFIDTLDLCP